MFNHITDIGIKSSIMFNGVLIREMIRRNLVSTDCLQEIVLLVAQLIRPALGNEQNYNEAVMVLSKLVLFEISSADILAETVKTQVESELSAE